MIGKTPKRPAGRQTNSGIITADHAKTDGIDGEQVLRSRLQHQKCTQSVFHGAGARPQSVAQGEQLLHRRYLFVGEHRRGGWRLWRLRNWNYQLECPSNYFIVRRSEKRSLLRPRDIDGRNHGGGYHLKFAGLCLLLGSERLVHIDLLRAITQFIVEQLPQLLQLGQAAPDLSNCRFFEFALARDPGGKGGNVR